MAPELNTDLEAAEWLEPIRVLDGNVASLMPASFDAYVEIEHLEHEGNLPTELGIALASALRSHTDTPNGVWYCVWEGWAALGFLGDSWENPNESMARLTRGSRPRVRLLRPRRASRRPPGPVELPARRYFLLRGTLDDAGHDFDMPRRVVTSHRVSAQMWWPDDHAWFVATEVDATATYVGTTRAAAADLVEAGLGSIIEGSQSPRWSEA